MPNGRCYHHGGPTPRGRAHGSFKTGQHTTLAREERAEARAIRKAARVEYLEAVEPYLKFGATRALEIVRAKRRYDEEMAAALELELAWQDRHHPRGPDGKLIWIPPKNWGKPRKPRRQSPDGYANIKFPENRGKYTKAAKALRAALRVQLAMIATRKK
jgi:hypothetical protein